MVTSETLNVTVEDGELTWDEWYAGWQAALGTKTGDAGYNAVYDWNSDGIIDLDDYNLALAYYFPNGNGDGGITVELIGIVIIAIVFMLIIGKTLSWFMKYVA